jgi:hypothetical protein
MVLVSMPDTPDWPSPVVWPSTPVPLVEVPRTPWEPESPVVLTWRPSWALVLIMVESLAVFVLPRRTEPPFEASAGFAPPTRPSTIPAPAAAAPSMSACLP